MEICDACSRPIGWPPEAVSEPVLSGAEHFWYRVRTVFVRAFVWFMPIHVGARIGTTPLTSGWDMFLLVSSMAFCLYALDALLCEQRPYLVYWHRGDPYRRAPNLWEYLEKNR